MRKKYISQPFPSYQNLKVDVTVNVSDLPVSSIALHPTSDLAVTGSDDKQWYLWSVPSNKSRKEVQNDDDRKSSNNNSNNTNTAAISPRLAPAQLQMSGTGHSDWISSVDFHPTGQMLATGAGDATVKIWDIDNNQKEIISFNDHQNAIWGVSFHGSGHFLASCSMDTTAKIWDLSSQRCRTTLRGHNDSINTLEFLEFSNTLLTGSADKTLKLWDARTQLCAHTYSGHTHSINSASFSKRGDKMVSTDSFGIVNIWDIRNTRSEIRRVDLGIHAGNSIKYHPSGDFIVVACADGSVKVLDCAQMESGDADGNEESNIYNLNSVNGHTDSVNDIVFGHEGSSLFSCSSDGSMRIWR